MGGIKETPLMRNPVLLNRYRKSSIKLPGGEAYLLKAYLRGWINRDRGLRKDDGISSPLRTRIQSRAAQEQEGWRSCSQLPVGNKKKLNSQLNSDCPTV